MASPEMKVHIWLKREILKKYPKAYIYKPRSGTYGKRGVPDFLCCINDLFISIEVKADKTKHVTKSQIAELLKIIYAGGLSFTINGKDKLKLDKIFNKVDKSEIRRL
jgi:Holliday junction resolvase